MRNETLYATAAQVLPTLLIAIVVEVNLLLVSSLAMWRRDDDRKDAIRYAVWGALGVGAVFLLGELAAITVLVFGTGKTLTWIAGPLVIAALLALSVWAVTVPAVRLMIRDI